MFQQLFARHHITCVIADARALTLRDGVLYHHDLPVDLVYNRLTDLERLFPAFRSALERLQRLYQEWSAYKARRSNALKRLLVRPPPPEGKDGRSRHELVSGSSMRRRDLSAARR